MAFIPVSPFQQAFASHSITCTSVRRPRRVLVPKCTAVPTPQSKPASAPYPSPSPQEMTNYESAYSFLQSVGLSVEDTRRVLSRLPRLTEQPDLEATATPMLNYLRSDLRLNRKQIARAVRFAPHVFFRSPDTFDSRLEFLDTVARISAADRAAAIAKCPHVLWMDLQAASRVVQIVLDACPLIAPASLGAVFARVPQALVTAPERIAENIERIRVAGVCDAASMVRVIAKAPLALVYDPNNTIDKRLAYLSTELSLPLTTVGKVLVAVPQVLDWSVDKVLRPRIQLLQTVVGADAVAALVDKVPSILGVEDAIDRVLWLRERVGLSEAQIRTVIREAPAVLTYSVVGNLAPKWAFISETMNGTSEDVVAAPRESLCANLQQRAMPRYAFLASLGRNDVPVVDMLRGSDVDFCKHVAQCDPTQFREYVDNDTYLLFFSQLM